MRIDMRFAHFEELSTLFFVYLMVVVSACANGAQFPPELNRVLNLAEGEIDVGIVALTLAKEIYPDLDVPSYSRKIDEIVFKARQLAAGTLDPEKRIRVLDTVIFLREGYRYDRTPFARSKQEYYFLNGILDSKLGICYTLPLLYLAVAQRLKYLIYPVAAPDHMFLRYADASFKAQNIEVTSGGKYFPDTTYVEDFSISKRAIESGSYLRTLTYREFLGHMLAANAFVMGQRGDGNKVMAYFERAAQLDPKFADHHNNLAEMYFAKSAVVRGELVTKYRDKAKEAAWKAKELGYVSQETIALGRETRGK